MHTSKDPCSTPCLQCPEAVEKWPPAEVLGQLPRGRGGLVPATALACCVPEQTYVLYMLEQTCVLYLSERTYVLYMPEQT